MTEEVSHGEDPLPEQVDAATITNLFDLLYAFETWAIRTWPEVEQSDLWQQADGDARDDALNAATGAVVSQGKEPRA
jgi:hypothetical protein